MLHAFDDLVVREVLTVAELASLTGTPTQAPELYASATHPVTGWVWPGRKQPTCNGLANIGQSVGVRKSATLKYSATSLFISGNTSLSPSLSCLRPAACERLRWCCHSRFERLSRPGTGRRFRSLIGPNEDVPRHSTYSPRLSIFEEAHFLSSRDSMRPDPRLDNRRGRQETQTYTQISPRCLKMCLL